jgi:flagellar motility protein MotE (MotC chaperone)
LTPATEKALGWLDSLNKRAFVGTESRLLTVFDLLKQIVAGAQTNKDVRIAELEKRKADIDAEISAIQAGVVKVMDDTALKDRFLLVSSTARELLGDFRSVEQNFRELDQQVRERVSTWEGRKGELLEQIFGARDAIADSDQGKSFRAFWDFLMSPQSQDELTELLDQVFAMEALAGLTGDRRFKRIHFDWLEAGEHTQRTVAKLSQQLCRYLDDQAYLENKRIMQLLDGIAARSLAVKDALPSGDFMSVDEPAPGIVMPMERPLYNPPVKAVINAEVLTADGGDIDPQALFNQVFIDKAQLQSNIQKHLQERSQVTLTEVVTHHPLCEGLAELVAYLAIAGADRRVVFDESQPEQIK